MNSFKSNRALADAIKKDGTRAQTAARREDDLPKASPECVDALRLAALISFLTAGGVDDALLPRVFNLCPDNAKAFGAIGEVLAAQGRRAGAVDAFRRAVALEPDDAGWHCQLAVALHRLGRIDESLQNCQRALALDPAAIEPLKLLGTMLYESGRFAEALPFLSKVAAHTPTDPACLCNVAACLFELGQWDKVIALCDFALAASADYAPAYLNHGNVHAARREFAAAADAYRRALAAAPAYAKAHANLSVVLHRLGLLDEALAASRRAVELDPTDALSAHNHAQLLLMHGDYINGFRQYEWRFKCAKSSSRPPRFDQPQWQGEDLAGRTLLLHAEYGFGDTLQFVRYAATLASAGASIVLQVRPELTRLLRHSLPVRVVARGELLPPFDLHLPLMSLPRVLGTTLASIPAEVPYLQVEPTKLTAWRQRLDRPGPLKVGVVWSGSPGHKCDLERSLGAGAVLPMLLVPGVALYSLQAQPREADRLAVERCGDAVTDLGPLLADFSDTAAAIAALDLVVTVDTSVAHLAGALGRPVWVMLPYALDWRWLRDREDSPWYPTMRLFRQSRPGDWNSVLARLPLELTRVVAGERERLWRCPEITSAVPTGEA